MKATVRPRITTASLLPPLFSKTRDEISENGHRVRINETSYTINKKEPVLVL